MDRSSATALEKLSKAIAEIAESIAQLQVDVAKLDARVGAIDGQVRTILSHLDRQVVESENEKLPRDLDLERRVFGEPRTRKAVAEETRESNRAKSTPRKSTSMKSRKPKARSPSTASVGRR